MAASDCPIALGTIITDDYLNIMATSFGAMIEATDTEARVGYRYYRQVAMADFLAALLARCRATPGGPRSYALPDVPAEPAPAASQPGDPLTSNVFFPR